MEKTIYLDKRDPWSSHGVICGWLREFPAETRVLDVGSATGMVGRMVHGTGIKMFGLEPNADWAAVAKPYYVQVKTGTLENVEKDYLRDYQVVICGDVLEHMPDPFSALSYLVGLQQPEAVILISMPNIANIWVRLNLLFGRFNYADRGILDRTHLRFFTRRTMHDLILTAGLRIIHTVPTPLPLNIIHPFFETTQLGRLLHSCLSHITRIFPGLLGYQFVVYAIKPE